MLMAYLRKQLYRNYFLYVRERGEKELAWSGFPQGNVEGVGLA